MAEAVSEHAGVGAWSHSEARRRDFAQIVAASHRSRVEATIRLRQGSQVALEPLQLANAHLDLDSMFSIGSTT